MRRLHSPANAHPLKVVTGKRILLILDFGDAQHPPSLGQLAKRHSNLNFSSIVPAQGTTTNQG